MLQMLDTMSTVANFGVRWCTIIYSGSAIVTGGACHRTAVLRQLQVVSVLTLIKGHFLKGSRGWIPLFLQDIGYKKLKV